MRNDSNLNCRVCGYQSVDPPWGEDGRSPIYDFCPCCGVEHGYQDSSPLGARNYRTEWISAGAKWEEPASKPEGWDLSEQLSLIPSEFK